MQPTMTTPQGKLACNLCQRRFSRTEHLKRHVLIHTHLAPFHCQHCQKRFGRTDTLRRHMANCVTGSSRPITSLRQACERCQIKKRRCSRERPTCTTCQKAREPCVYSSQLMNSSSRLARFSTSDVGEECEIRGYTGTDSALPPFLDDSISTGNTGKTEENPLGHSGNYVHEEFACVDSSHTNPAPQVSASDNRSNDMLIPLTDPTTRESQLNPVHTITKSLKPPALPPTETFNFLVNFTKTYDLPVCFQSYEVENIWKLGSSNTKPQNTIQRTAAMVENYEAIQSNIYPTACGRASVSNYPSSWSSAPRAAILPQSSVTLATKAYELRWALKATDSNWSTIKELRCLDFFSVDRIPYFLELYWALWHPNWPVIHKPTFEILDCPVSLLAAMVIVGACHAPDRQDPGDAWYWFEAVEQCTLYKLHDSMIQYKSYDKIRHLQAAFLVCIYQTWAGEDNARIRIRRYGFNTIVNAMRDTDISSARHDIPRTFHNFDWSAFIQMEETIRTLLWVFCLDTAYVIFNNMPPRLALRELRMGLASCETCFQATTAWECFSALHTWQAHCPRPPRLSMYGLIRTFFAHEIDPHRLGNLAHESFMNLWCVVGAFHVMLFNVDPVYGGKEQFCNLQIGFDNWKAVWNRRLANNDERYFDVAVAGNVPKQSSLTRTDLWKRAGFWKHAGEYWLLAQVMLDRMVSAHESTEAADELCGPNGLQQEVASHVVNEIEDDSMCKLRYFLLSVILQKY